MRRLGSLKIEEVVGLLDLVLGFHSEPPENGILGYLGHVGHVGRWDSGTVGSSSRICSTYTKRMFFVVCGSCALCKANGAQNSAYVLQGQGWSLELFVLSRRAIQVTPVYTEFTRFERIANISQFAWDSWDTRDSETGSNGRSSVVAECM